MSNAFGIGLGAVMPDVEPRCWRCGRMLARLVTRPWILDCTRCRARNQRLPEGQTSTSYGLAPPRRGPRPAPHPRVLAGST